MQPTKGMLAALKTGRKQRWKQKRVFFLCVQMMELTAAESEKGDVKKRKKMVSPNKDEDSIHQPGRIAK